MKKHLFLYLFFLACLFSALLIFNGPGYAGNKKSVMYDTDTNKTVNATIDYIKNVNIATSSLGGGEMLRYNDSTEFWEAIDPVLNYLGDVSIATDSLLNQDILQYNSSNEKWERAPAKFDVIGEYTADTGVTVDGVLNKDGGITLTDSVQTNTIIENTSGLGVNIDGLTIKDSGIELGSDADLDLYYRKNGILTRLPGGTALQYPRINAAGDDYEFTSTAATSYSGTFTSGDLVAGVLTVTHGLGDQYGHAVTIVDNNGKKMGDPDEITYTGTNALTVDMSSWEDAGIITGTWRIKVIK